MDVVYVVPSNFAAMAQTPGAFLASELERIGMSRAELARLVDVNWPTVDRWVKGNGFSKKNRELAARAMGFQPDHFERPDYTSLHQELRERAIAEFLASELAPPDVTDEERVALHSQQLPLTRKPTRHFYMALLSLLRGHLDPADFATELDENEALAASVAAKLGKQVSKVPSRKAPSKKKAPKRVARKSK
jgi:hypothetical protein